MLAPSFVIQNDVCACVEIIFLHVGVVYVPAAFSLVNGVSAGMCACADTELGELCANCGASGSHLSQPDENTSMEVSIPNSRAVIFTP